MAGIVEGLHDGYPTTIALSSSGTLFAAASATAFEKTVQPPGIDGGEPIDEALPAG